MANWLRDLGRRDGLAAAFDTRLNGVPVFTGRASRPIAKVVKAHGRRLVAASESFMVGSQNTLLDGETARARRWGMTARRGEQDLPDRAGWRIAKAR